MQGFQDQVSSRFSYRPATRFALVAAALLCAAASVWAQEGQDDEGQDDPPSRVARLSYIGGDINFAPAGENDWSDATLNRPLIEGDRLMTGQDARAEMELGSARLRIGAQTGFSLLNLDDNTVQIELTDGTLNLQVQSLDSGETYEVDTPTIAFVVDRPGEYRIDVTPNGDSTSISVFNGKGTIYGEGGAKRELAGSQTWRFNKSDLSDVVGMPLRASDDFDRWCFSRNDPKRGAVAVRRVAPEVVGYRDLDEYGDWDSEPEYGDIWYPRTVVTDWAPYRYGHWVWIDPWGWTWVDDAPWGFAPFHYGRWVYARNRWGWCPGPVHVRPVYAPALVAFVGGANWSVSVSSGRPVGWFPLGPRDVYCPPYRVTRRYFNNVNVTNVRVHNDVHVTNVYNNYYRNGRIDRTRVDNMHYANRGVRGATTVVSQDTFVRARPVGREHLRLNDDEVARASVTPAVDFKPTRQSLGRNENRGRNLPKPAAVFDRAVVARNTPPPTRASFTERQAQIERNRGPMDREQLRQSSRRPALAERNVSPSKPAPASTFRPSASEDRAQEARVPDPIRSRRDTPSSGRERQGELPSSRYAPGRNADRSANSRMERDSDRRDSRDSAAARDRQRLESTPDRSARDQAQQPRTAVEAPAARDRGRVIRAPDTRSDTRDEPSRERRNGNRDNPPAQRDLGEVIRAPRTDREPRATDSPRPPRNEARTVEPSLPRSQAVPERAPAPADMRERRDMREPQQARREVERQPREQRGGDDRGGGREQRSRDWNR
jgi:hypothetical protein